MPKPRKGKENVENSFIDRKPHQRIPLSDQLNIVQQLENGKSQADIVRSLGLSKSTVNRIRKQSDSLKSIQVSKSVPMKSKLRKVKAKYPQLDKAMFD